MGPEAAEAKLVYAKACQKFDFVTTKGEDLQNLKSTLVEEGAEIDDITGDMGTNAVVILAHKEVLLECDLGSVQQSRLPSQFAFQCCNLPQLLN